MKKTSGVQKKEMELNKKPCLTELLKGVTS